MAGNPAYLQNAGLILPELSLGMDMLKQRHPFMSFGEPALYVAPAKAAGGGQSAKP